MTNTYLKNKVLVVRSFSLAILIYRLIYFERAITRFKCLKRFHISYQWTISNSVKKVFMKVQLWIVLKDLESALNNILKSVSSNLLTNPDTEVTITLNANEILEPRMIIRLMTSFGVGSSHETFWLSPFFPLRSMLTFYGLSDWFELDWFMAQFKKQMNT